MLIDRWWLSRIVSSKVSVPSTVGSSFLETRVDTVVQTLLSPGGTSMARNAMTVMVVALIAGALAIRLRAGAHVAFRVGAVVAIAAGIVVAVSRPPDTVSGLLLVFPVLTVGLVLLRRADLTSPPAAVLVLACAGFTAFVLLLQYQQGGGAEWGGRFLAIELPIVGALAVAVLARVGTELTRVDRRLGVATLVVVSLCMASLSVASLRYYRNDVTSWWVEHVDEARSRTPGSAIAANRPLVVTSWLGLGRFMWSSAEPPVGLWVASEDLEAFATSLREAGVRDLVFVTQTPLDDLPALTGLYEVVEGYPASRAPNAPITVLRAR
jgi:hypothetical protein